MNARFRTLLVGVAIGALTSAAHAVCNHDDDELEQYRSSAPPARVTMEFSGNKASGLRAGDASFRFIRRASDGMVIGLEDAAGTRHLLDMQREVVRQPLLLPRANAGQPEETGASTNSNCGGSGNSGPYDSQVLQVTITAPRAPSVAFWTETAQTLVFTPQMPAPIEPPPVTLPLTDRQLRCTGSTNNCLQSADRIANNAYQTCSDMAEEVGRNRGRWWGAAIIGLTAAACTYGIEAARNHERTQCFMKHADCMAGS